MEVDFILDIQFFRTVVSLGDLPSSGQPEICIAGRSNVGKSSMINRLANRRKLARISRQPGKTRAMNFYIAGNDFYFVDLPGYGYAKIPKSERNFFARLVNPYLENRKELKGVIQLIDARHGPVSGDLDMLEWLKQWRGRILYVLTKSDKLSGNERVKAEKSFIKEFGAEECIMFSAVTGMGVEGILSWIDDTLDSTVNTEKRGNL